MWLMALISPMDSHNVSMVNSPNDKNVADHTDDAENTDKSQER